MKPHRATRSRKPVAFQKLVRRVRQRLLTAVDNPIPSVILDRVLRESEETAVASGYPLLFFPELAREQFERISDTGLYPKDSSRFAAPALPPAGVRPSTVSRAAKSRCLALDRSCSPVASA